MMLGLLVGDQVRDVVRRGGGNRRAEDDRQVLTRLPCGRSASTQDLTSALASQSRCTRTVSERVGMAEGGTLTRVKKEPGWL